MNRWALLALLTVTCPSRRRSSRSGWGRPSRFTTPVPAISAETTDLYLLAHEDSWGR